MEATFQKYPAYKNSGVEWLGVIPEGWEVIKLKYIVNINCNSLAEDCDKNYKFKYVDIGSVSYENGIERTDMFSFKNAPSRARRRAKKNDTIVSTVRTYLKAIDFIDKEKEKFIYSTGFAVLQPDVSLINAKYANAFIKTSTFTNQVDIASKGMSYPAINSTDLSNLLVVIPPKEEQTAIATITTEDSVSHVQCPGDQTGTAYVEVTAGDGYPFTFVWKNEKGQTITNHIANTETTSHITHLTEGVYTCKITDVNGYTETLELEILVTNAIYDELERIDITTDMSNQEISYLEGFTIPSGNTVTLTNCTLKFAEDAYVIVEEGAYLKLINSTLSNEDQCGNFLWQGLEVWGIKSLSQNYTIGSFNQGKLFMDGSTIKNAVNAISVWGRNENNLNKAGGIVIAQHSHFINNVCSIIFKPYHNIAGGTEQNNLSQFKNCNFIINNSNYIQYNESYEFSKHIDLYDVKGIKFVGGLFSNTASQGVSEYNRAIASLGAGFDIDSYCTSTPCTSGDPTHFIGFYRAVSTYESNDQSYSFCINHALFENNMYGVYDDGVNNATIINSTFKIGENTVDGGACPSGSYGHGIYMRGNSLFTIENNTFNRYATAPVGGNYKGIVLDEVEAISEIIYKNEFTGLEYGNFTHGDCRENYDHDYKGPRYMCNHNSGNKNDFYFENANTLPNGDGDAAVNTFQGNSVTASRNTFSDSQNPGFKWHIYNGGTQDINYYYYNASSEIPTELWWSPNSPNDLIVLYEVTGTPYGCPDNVGGGSSGGGAITLSPESQQEQETNYANALSDYQSVKNIYESYKDGGSTPQEVMDVESAQPNDMWALRAQLLGHSPHLSQEVLIKTSDRTDVFPESVLFDILAANPDELKKKELMDYLEEKEEPLPDYMIELLRDIAKDTTYKTTLLRHMRNHTYDYKESAHNIIRSLLYADTLDFQELRNWYDNRGDLVSDRQIVQSYLHEGDYSSAISLLDMLPSLYELEGEALIEHNNYKQMIEMRHQWELAGIEKTQLDSLRIDTLANIADTARGMAGAMARGLLEYAYGYHFVNCTECGNQNKNSELGGWKLPENKPAKVQLEVSPNPANTWIRFKYELPENSTAIIRISNANGQTIAELPLQSGMKEYVWDVRNIPSGTYYYHMDANNQIASGTFIINH